MARAFRILSALLLVAFLAKSRPIDAKAVSAIPSSNPKLASAKRIRNRKDRALVPPHRPPKHSEAAWLSGLKNSLASSLAAASSKIILAPFDTIKTLQQHSRSSASATPLTLVEAAQGLLKRPRGVLELYVSTTARARKLVHDQARMVPHNGATRRRTYEKMFPVLVLITSFPGSPLDRSARSRAWGLPW